MPTKETRKRRQEHEKKKVRLLQAGIEEYIEEEEIKGREIEQELGKREKRIYEKAVDEQEKLAKKRKEKDIEEERLKRQEVGQDLEKREAVMDEKIIEKREKTGKEEKRKRGGRRRK